MQEIDVGICGASGKYAVGQTSGAGVVWYPPGSHHSSPVVDWRGVVHSTLCWLLIVRQCAIISTEYRLLEGDLGLGYSRVAVHWKGRIFWHIKRRILIWSVTLKGRVGPELNLNRGGSFAGKGKQVWSYSSLVHAIRLSALVARWRIRRCSAVFRVRNAYICARSEL